MTFTGDGCCLTCLWPCSAGAQNPVWPGEPLIEQGSTIYKAELAV